MNATTWPVVTCTACGATGPGPAKARLCNRCDARALHPVRPCAGCGETRRHLAAGLCARCYRLSRTRLVLCPACGELRPLRQQVTRLWSGRCCTCRARFYETTGACADCGDLTRLTSGMCRACRLF